MTIKILAIDDDPAMTELLKILLEANNFEIITSNSSVEGIELVKKIQPDIILLDLMMPEMDGRETCQEIRRFSNTPILIISALDNPGTVANTLDAGADYYLIKPVPSSLLIAHIKNLTRRHIEKIQLPSAPKPPKVVKLPQTAEFAFS